MKSSNLCKDTTLLIKGITNIYKNKDKSVRLSGFKPALISININVRITKNKE